MSPFDHSIYMKFNYREYENSKYKRIQLIAIEYYGYISVEIDKYNMKIFHYFDQYN